MSGAFSSVAVFQSTRPSRGETDDIWFTMVCYEISIHSPLAGRDVWTPSTGGTGRDFNPLAPRGARRAAGPPRPWSSYFNPLAPRGARRGRARRGRRAAEISIHSPLAGRDSIDCQHSVFNRISIHSPLAGRDRRSGSGRYRIRGNFNPLAPRGARQNRTITGYCPAQFQSTRPSRGETCSNIVISSLL